MPKFACIVRKSDGATLVRASLDTIQTADGNRYFPADAIDTRRFETSDRLYHCPYKGMCNWVDFKSDKGYINDVSWVYAEPLPDYQRIAGCFGFYPDHKYYRYSECD